MGSKPAVVAQFKLAVTGMSEPAFQRCKKRCVNDTYRFN
jgi:hypothetical protein